MASHKQDSLQPETKPVAKNHAFDEKRLAEYMRQHVDGYSFAEQTGPLKVRQFAYGQSNPTFFLEVGSGDNTRRYVLRKKPPGKLLPSAHAVDREYRVMTALRSTMVPVPVTHCLCMDNSVIGTPFFIMDYVHGRIFKKADLPGMSAAQRFAIYSAMNQVLAALHAVDYKAVGLGDYGPTQSYVERNVKRWTSQYAASKTEDIPDVNHLGDWLMKNIPQDEDSQKICLIHGDYRVDNLIFHPKDNRILAVLDWELSTLGHPTVDLAYNCLPYHCPSDFAMLAGLKGLEIKSLGLPSEKDYVAAYVRNARRQGPIVNWNFYLALSFFRSAAIGQGVYKRSLQGNASSDQANLFLDITRKMAQIGRNISSGSSDKESKEDPRSMLDLNLVGFNFSKDWYKLRAKLLKFMDDHIYPNEATYYAQHAALAKEHGHPWVIPPIVEQLKAKAKEQGLWNLFLAKSKVHPHNFGAGLTNLEYSPLCEIMGRSVGLAPEVFNCSAPDTGNMEVLTLYGSPEQQQQWLKPLLAGEIRSCFGMTEPRVASSDATNIECSIRRSGDSYVVNGRKWWTSGAMDPRTKLCILMGKTQTTGAIHKQQSMILVPMDAPGVKIVRALHVYGYDDAPHGHAEVVFDNVKVPLENMLLGEGRGFEIAQGRLGPGRIHHCMRMIGIAERCLEMMCQQVQNRTAFGTALAVKGTILHDIAESRIEIQQARLLTLQAAAMMDIVGNKFARQQIAMIKVAAPHMACRVIDRALQAHGAKGVCQDTILPSLWTHARTLRLADGPDEVHRETIAKIEIRRAKL